MEEQTELTKKERRELKRKAKEAERARKVRAKKIRRYVTTSFVVLVVVVAVAGLWKLSQKSTSPSLAPAEVLQVQSDDWTKGNADSAVTFVEYVDFECEACRAYYPLVKRLVEEYEDEVFFIFRYFPLPNHRNGMTSALAVEAAGRQGKYWEMHDLLFEEQINWGEQASSDSTMFEKYAEQLDLNMEQFKQDVKSQEIKERVTKDRTAANRIGVNSTPTFFLNGEKIKNPRGYDAFKALLDSALEK